MYHLAKPVVVPLLQRPALITFLGSLLGGAVSSVIDSSTGSLVAAAGSDDRAAAGSEIGPGGFTAALVGHMGLTFEDPVYGSYLLDGMVQFALVSALNSSGELSDSDLAQQIATFYRLDTGTWSDSKYEDAIEEALASPVDFFKRYPYIPGVMLRGAVPRLISGIECALAILNGTHPLAPNTGAGAPRLPEVNP